MAERLSIRVVVAAIALPAAALAMFAAPARATKLGRAGDFTYYTEEDPIPAGAGEQGATGTAQCGDGQAVTGGGEAISGNPDGSFIGPVIGSALDTWLATGWHNNGDTAALTTWAICTKKASKIDIFEDFDSAPAGPKSATLELTCEQGHPTTASGQISGSPLDSFLNTLMPTQDGWEVHAFHRAGTSDADILGFVHCRKGAPPNYRVKSKASSGPTIKVKAACRNHEAVIGGGASASGGAGQAHLIESSPFDSGDQGDIPDDGWQVEYYVPGAVEQEFAAFAVCDPV
ncbi:MAG: hypothetical protein QOI31_2146 [Solirubrobacterales bacterium]|jgi:hypothetical protein|nr:hypothetical protein [Solirubrobacterales bacterium]